MANRWREAKIALGLNRCLDLPKTLEGSSSSSSGGDARRLSDAASDSPVGHPTRPVSQALSSSGTRISKSSPKSPSKKTCAICLTEMKRGHGQAIFMAECSHSFHFHCITSNVKHGNRICPICRSRWKELPYGPPSNNASSNPPIQRPGFNNPLDLPRDDAWATVAPRWSPPANRPIPEPPVFDDDDVVLSAHLSESVVPHATGSAFEVKTHPQVPSVAKTVSCDDFAVLIHVKAPGSSTRHARAPVDLITVLDVSGSMSGTKIALLKSAMGFVIQNLGPTDRLSIVSFSSSARRVFALRLMSETGKQEALQAIHSLVANGGTNIAEGLRKGAKVIVERRWKNPVSGIILLSDGQDTHTLTPGTAHSKEDYESLLPVSIQRNTDTRASGSSTIPVHAFGFGLDHDAALMHAISDISRGTFSFIEAENVIQDAFAQCIGGLLSVVVQELRVEFDCVHPSLQIKTIKAGSYPTHVRSSGKHGWIDVGDLYAEEERDFLLILDIPVDGSESDGEMCLLRVKCVYKDPFTKETVVLEEEAGEVKIQRPRVLTGENAVSIEVDRQRNRFRVAQVMSEARALAEQSDLNGAVSLLETCRRELSQTVSAQAGDRLCDALSAELLVMQERMANRGVYETTGRAYVLSSMSSHSAQRATARGDSTSRYSRVQAYQTTSMSEMVSRSQTLESGNPSSNPPPNSRSNPNLRKKLHQTLSFPGRQHPE